MSQRRPRRPIRRLILGVVLSAIIIGGIGVYWVWQMSWQAPAWYAPPEQADAVASQRADDTEYRLLQQTRQVRQTADVWTLTLTEAEINAWLATRLPAWIEHDANVPWPREIGTPQVLVERDGLSIAVPVTAKGVTRTVVAKVRPSVGERPIELETGEGLPSASQPAAGAADHQTSANAAASNGLLWLPLTSVSLGKVWIPGQPLQRVIDEVRDAAPQFLDDPRVQQAIDALAGRSGLGPVYQLGDGRVVRITGVQLKRGEIALTAQTLTDAADRSNP